MATQDQRHPYQVGHADRTVDGTVGASRDAAQTSHPDPECVALYCPECGMPTWVEWSDGDHVKIRCFSRHWFLMLGDRLA